MISISCFEKWYFNEYEIEIIKKIPSFNLAIVRKVDKIEEFVVDTNFLSTQPIGEKKIVITI